VLFQCRQGPSTPLRFMLHGRHPFVNCFYFHISCLSRPPPLYFCNTTNCLRNMQRGTACQHALCRRSDGKRQEFTVCRRFAYGRSRACRVTNYFWKKSDLVSPPVQCRQFLGVPTANGRNLPFAVGSPTVGRVRVVLQTIFGKNPTSCRLPTACRRKPRLANC
jgi:hypothetical protein